MPIPTKKSTDPILLVTLIISNLGHGIFIVKIGENTYKIVL